MFALGGCQVWCVTIYSKLFVIFWQLRKDSGNVEARDHLDQLQPTEESIHQARLLIERNQYEEAVQILARPIEV